MSKQTSTKKHRMIYDKGGVNPITGKELLTPTGDYMPSQPRTFVTFEASDGRKCGAWVSAGEAINPRKWFKRKERTYDPEQKLWI